MGVVIGVVVLMVLTIFIVVFVVIGITYSKKTGSQDESSTINIQEKVPASQPPPPYNVNQSDRYPPAAIVHVITSRDSILIPVHPEFALPSDGICSNV